MLGHMEKMMKTALLYADQAEIYAERGRAISLELEKSRIKKTSDATAHGIGIRVIIKKRLGFAYATDLGKTEELVLRAVTQAKASRRDSDFRTLPSACKYTKTKKCYDASVEKLTPETALEYALEMVNAAKEYHRCIMPTATNLSAGYSEAFVLNSEGIEVSDKGTFFSANISLTADGKVSAEEGQTSRYLKEIDFGWIGREAAHVAVESLRAVSIEKKEMPLILTPRALQSLLSYTTIRQLSAESVQRGQSPYRRGMRLGSEIVNMTDDGTLAGGVCTSKMDGEGVAKQRTLLVRNGMLKNFLYDSYTAHKEGTKSTGNAARGYSTPPRIDATNFIIGGTNCKKKELLGGWGRPQLFATDVIGAHTANRTSGEFSVVIHNGFLVKKGEMKAVKGAMIAGDMPDMLRKIDLIADDVRKVGGLVSPSVRVSSISVASG